MKNYKVKAWIRREWWENGRSDAPWDDVRVGEDVTATLDVWANDEEEATSLAQGYDYDAEMQSDCTVVCITDCEEIGSEDGNETSIELEGWS